ncbi:hypothetical protein QBC46DRAFT_338695 [Diplogelasinospora grovesii]|uniref:Uncharacterized protein n=1 Tax=Diplogelasinospora grovesii TaxID=303347 RepID=A0AAN6S808_9PEZI|nr:hypothetical protein QBC46DRAFT_338695 [Diplogelasinospora grovesii]
METKGTGRNFGSGGYDLFNTDTIRLGPQALDFQRIGDYGENSEPVGGVDPPTPTATTHSGSLRGDSSLLGGNAPLPDPDTSDSAVVSDARLVNSQTADAKLGLYLDFNSANPPQPIRGDKGTTSPGLAGVKPMGGSLVLE